ncbi:unnamed protein product, partial [Ectocarpus sp. 4 AP-2014]
KNTALKYETKAGAVGDADNCTSETEKPIRRRNLSPKHGTAPHCEVAKKCAFQKPADRARSLRGLQREVRVLMRLHCSELRSTEFGRWAPASVKRDRESEHQRRYMERRVAECGREAVAMDAQALALFAKLTKGEHVTLLQPHAQRLLRRFGSVTPTMGTCSPLSYTSAWPTLRRFLPLTQRPRRWTRLRGSRWKPHLPVDELRRTRQQASNARRTMNVYKHSPDLSSCNVDAIPNTQRWATWWTHWRTRIRNSAM